ncbi:reticulocalbin-2-like isoform X2 [Haliotis rufescens]|uniref:reticulocalbin-2-like isoform X2 n=1 Tax=Haliotis rufescens TaxID=6454 RepID=UPI001EB08D8E|nr:reticulocalbin-2-like isoform X2 [Haliotis rufescens]
MRNRQLATTATSGSYKCTREHLRVQKELNRCFPFLDSSSVRVTMKGFTCVLSMCLAMTLVLAVTKVNAENKEKIAPAAHAQHDPLGGVNETADGERNKHRDHEAVLGSREEAQDADDLTPEQAKNRLEKLAKTHDLDKDGRISKEEFITWILQSLKSLDEEEALKKLAEEDGDGDGKLAFGEYLKQQYDYSQEELKAIKEKPLDDDHKFMIETIGEDEKRFTAADQDKNGILDKSEYVAFMHPYDYEHMHAYEIEHRLKEFDQDNDTAVSLIEFLAEFKRARSFLYSSANIVRIQHPETSDISLSTLKLDNKKTLNEDDEDATSMDQLRFRKYDTDNDGFLKGDELKTWLTQGNLETATEEVEYLTSKADANKDGFLSLAEIRDHDEDFISSKATDYGDTLLKFKDEL